MANRNEKGVCHICGELKELSFEHIPPRSAGNNGPSKMYRAADIVETCGAFDSSKTEGVRYQQEQKGTGFRTLCRDCNSYLGRNYVGEYAKCIRELGCMLAKNPPAEGEGGIRLVGKDINALAFFKHVIGNFSATTAAGSMADCRKYLLDRESRDFPGRYRLFMFAVPERGAGMLSTGWATLLLDSGQQDYYTIAAIAAFPVGFFLLDARRSSIAPSGIGCEITAIAALEWGAKPGFAVELPYMSIEKMWPVPIMR
ncbi:MAG: hypothetical protein IJ113_00360 [Eggerthellaceae bacterium]|nr:hypothetical protein [Eggerthellaceae bacterium]